MNIERLAQYVGNNLPLNKEALSEFKELTEKYPYFQTAHLFLLKTMLNVDEYNYKEQLALSGCFISNKQKLFKFVTSKLPEIKTEKTTEKPKEDMQDTDNKEFKHIADKLPTQPQEKPKVVVEEPPKTKPKVAINLSDEEIDKLNFDNSTKRHKNIVGDFFDDLSSKDELIDDKKTTESTEKDKVSSKSPDVKNRTTRRTQPLLKSEILNTENKKNETKKTETKKEAINNDKKTPVSVTKTEKKPAEKITENKEEDSRSKKMNELFSKIKNIKKEISRTESDNKSGVINLNEDDKKKAAPKSKKPNIVIKESFISNDEDDDLENDNIEEIKESELTAKDLFKQSKPVETTHNETVTKKISQPETTEVKEKAPDTKSREVKKEITKETVKEEKPSNENKGKTPAEKLKEKIEKLRNEKANEKANENIDKVVNKPVSAKPVIENSTKTESKPANSGTLSAADKLLQKVANRRNKISVEKEKENQKKEELKKKEIDAVNEIIKNTPKKKVNFINDDENSTTTNEVKTEVKNKVEELASNKEDDTKSQVVLSDTEEPLNEQKLVENKSKEESDIKIYTKKQEEQKEEVILSEEKPSETNEKTEVVVEKSENSTIKDSTNNDADDTNIDTKKSQEKEQKTVTEKKEKTEKKSKKDINALIDNFLEKSDSLERIGVNESKLKGDISIKSTSESDDYMTEPYAELLIQQKKYSKAREVYQKLILKYPEKKTYFAIQIKKVERFIK